MTYKKGYIPLLIVLVAVSGCGKKKKELPKNKRSAVASQVDFQLTDGNLTVAGDQSVRSFFLDDNAKELVEVASDNDSAVVAEVNTQKIDDFAWMQTAGQKEKGFDVVYFDFDKFAVRQDQQLCVEHDVQAAKQALADARKSGDEPTIIVEGHACHSAGSSTYNLALSEKRALAVQEWFVGENVPKENIKIVGRGSEVPAIVNGKPVSGNREEQWANRRVEVHIIHA